MRSLWRSADSAPQLNLPVASSSASQLGVAIKIKFDRGKPQVLVSTFPLTRA